MEIKDYAVSLRPFSFDDMCGQKAIIAEMKKRSLDNGFPSVMIFGGASGTGKTTLAMIIGALVNDENPLQKNGFNDPNPDSPESKAIIQEQFTRNVSFYDASEMKKGDVEQLKEVVSTKSLFGGKKVIIIDEAQELSKQSKGATLKLLEKKRDDVFIILCTMNPESFDKSIRSRGAFYLFKSPTVTEIAEYLFSILDRQGIEVPDEFLSKGLFTIGENCEGSVRMAVQTFERCITGELFAMEQIQQEFGYVTNETLMAMIKKFVTKDTTVFSDIKNLGLKEFFHQSNKVISEMVVYLRTGFCSVKWKEAHYEKFAQNKKQVYDLFKLYTEIDLTLGSYFKEAYCLAKLSEFFESSEQPVLKRR